MNIAPVNFANINFAARKNAYTVPYGIDYSWVDEYKANDFSKTEIALAAKEGRLTQEMRDELILDRLPKTLRHAKKFIKEHPEFEEDEVSQQLISYVVQIAQNYKGQDKGNFNSYAYRMEYYYLEGLAAKRAKEADWHEYGADIRNVKDNQLDLSLRAMLAQDIQSAVSQLDTWEEDVIRHRYGLNGVEPKSVALCADEFDTTEETVKRVESQAIRRLSYPYRIYDICEDVAYIKSGDDNDKLALLADRGKLSEYI